MRKFFGCYLRENVKTSEEELDFKPVGVKNFPPILVAPISEGLCAYKDIYELSLEDFINMNEIVMVKHENERRARKAAEKKSKKS